MSLLALLLLFYCIIHGPPGSVRHVAVTVQQQPCCDLSHFVIAEGGASMSMCMLVRFCIPGMHAWSVCCYKISIQQHVASGDDPLAYPRVQC